MSCRYLLFFLSCVLLSGCTKMHDARSNQAAAQASVSSLPQEQDEKQIREKLTDALMNDRLRFEVVREAGGRHPCEPQEPYYRLDVSRHTASPFMGDTSVEVREQWNETDLGEGIVLIESTGEVAVMDVCLE